MTFPLEGAQCIRSSPPFCNISPTIEFEASQISYDSNVTQISQTQLCEEISMDPDDSSTSNLPLAVKDIPSPPVQSLPSNPAKNMKFTRKPTLQVHDTFTFSKAPKQQLSTQIVGQPMVAGSFTASSLKPRKAGLLAFNVSPKPNTVGFVIQRAPKGKNTCAEPQTVTTTTEDSISQPNVADAPTASVDNLLIISDAIHNKRDQSITSLARASKFANSNQGSPALNPLHHKQDSLPALASLQGSRLPSKIPGLLTKGSTEVPRKQIMNKANLAQRRFNSNEREGLEPNTTQQQSEGDVWTVAKKRPQKRTYIKPHSQIAVQNENLDMNSIGSLFEVLGQRLNSEKQANESIRYTQASELARAKLSQRALKDEIVTYKTQAEAQRVQISKQNQMISRYEVRISGFQKSLDGLANVHNGLKDSSNQIKTRRIELQESAHDVMRSIQDMRQLTSCLTDAAESKKEILGELHQAHHRIKELEQMVEMLQKELQDKSGLLVEERNRVVQLEQNFHANGQGYADIQRVIARHHWEVGEHFDKLEQYSSLPTLVSSFLQESKKGRIESNDQLREGLKELKKVSLSMEVFENHIIQLKDEKFSLGPPSLRDQQKQTETLKIEIAKAEWQRDAQLSISATLQKTLNERNAELLDLRATVLGLERDKVNVHQHEKDEMDRREINMIQTVRESISARQKFTEDLMALTSENERLKAQVKNMEEAHILRSSIPSEEMRQLHVETDSHRAKDIKALKQIGSLEIQLRALSDQLSVLELKKQRSEDKLSALGRTTDERNILLTSPQKQGQGTSQGSHEEVNNLSLRVQQQDQAVEELISTSNGNIRDIERDRESNEKDAAESMELENVASQVQTLSTQLEGKGEESKYLTSGSKERNEALHRATHSSSLYDDPLDEASSDLHKLTAFPEREKADIRSKDKALKPIDQRMPAASTQIQELQGDFSQSLIENSGNARGYIEVAQTLRNATEGVSAMAEAFSAAPVAPHNSNGSEVFDRAWQSMISKESRSQEVISSSAAESQLRSNVAASFDTLGPEIRGSEHKSRGAEPSNTRRAVRRTLLFGRSHTHMQLAAPDDQEVVQPLEVLNKSACKCDSVISSTADLDPSQLIVPELAVLQVAKTPRPRKSAMKRSSSASGASKPSQKRAKINLKEDTIIPEPEVQQLSQQPHIPLDLEEAHGHIHRHAVSGIVPIASEKPQNNSGPVRRRSMRSNKGTVSLTR